MSAVKRLLFITSSAHQRALGAAWGPTDCQFAGAMAFSTHLARGAFDLSVQPLTEMKIQTTTLLEAKLVKLTQLETLAELFELPEQPKVFWCPEVIQPIERLGWFHHWAHFFGWATERRTAEQASSDKAKDGKAWKKEIWNNCGVPGVWKMSKNLPCNIGKVLINQLDSASLFGTEILRYTHLVVF